MIERVFLIVLDSAGIGAMPDAKLYGDEGSNTLGNIALQVGLHIPNMQKMGLGNITELHGINPVKKPTAAWGKMAELSPGKDTITGHWEIAGVVLEKPFKTFPQGFPQKMIEQFEKEIGRKILGNVVASGTEIIKQLGQEHMETGKPIVYTSADSVFQIAAHEKIIPLDELYGICQTARNISQDDWMVARVIARPFIGSKGNFTRTTNRKDFSIEPPSPTLLENIKFAGYEVVGIGKISDIFTGKGITKSISTESNIDGVHKISKAIETTGKGLVFANLVDYDSKYGHRNDPEGYAKALEEFDEQIPFLINKLNDKDVLIITADHGCDPTTKSTDHSREYVPLLIYGHNINPVNLGIRSSFSDLGATIADFLSVKQLRHGKSMFSLIVRNE
ncbi:MAG: phosphopentomutase [Zhaonellaceae bacterium]|jgi:phosphopentomutase|nr:phosphopentomutase [Clostridia bacterium]